MLEQKSSRTWLDELDSWESANRAARDKLREIDLRLGELAEKYACHRQALLSLQQANLASLPEPNMQARRLVLEVSAAAQHKSLNARRLAVQEALDHLSFLLELPD